MDETNWPLYLILGAFVAFAVVEAVGMLGWLIVDLVTGWPDED